MLKFTADGEFYDEELSLLVFEGSFTSMFGTDCSYSALYNHPNATPAWKGVFDSWKSRGIIS